eukprot:gene5184-3729_t
MRYTGMKQTNKQRKSKAYVKPEPNLPHALRREQCQHNTARRHNEWTTDKQHLLFVMNLTLAEMFSLLNILFFALYASSGAAMPQLITLVVPHNQLSRLLRRHGAVRCHSGVGVLVGVPANSWIARRWQHYQSPYGYPPPPPLPPPSYGGPQDPNQSYPSSNFNPYHGFASEAVPVYRHGAEGGMATPSTLPVPPPLGSSGNPIVLAAAEPKSDSASLGSKMFFWIIIFVALSTIFSFFQAVLGALMVGPGVGMDDPNSMFGRMLQNSPQHPVNLDNLEVTFSTIRGCDEAKEELEDLVAFLKDPEKFTALGGRLPKGVLLVGPPGCGKTLLAKAIAKEAGVSFFYAAASEFDEVFVGVGPRRIREIFAAAKKAAPAVIFIDEIDALAARRTNMDQGISRMSLNQLLSEMDGFQSSTSVVVIAATNTPDVLDKAITRPGRLDTVIAVDPPDMKGRADVLQLYLDKVKVDQSVKAMTIARGTTGFTGAELSNLVNIAAIRAATLSKPSVTMDDIEYAKDRVMMGAESKKAIPEEERRITAFHEGAHALAALLLKDEGAEPIHKATIVPRGSGIMGLVQQLPETDKYSQSKRQCLARLKVCLAGRIGEEMILGQGDVTTGASSDFQQASDMARNMIRRFGFSDVLGPVFYAPMNTAEGAYISEDSKRQIDEEVHRLVSTAYRDAKKLIEQNRDKLTLIADGLLQRETLTGEEIEKVVRGEPLPPLTAKPVRKAPARKENTRAAPQGIPIDRHTLTGRTDFYAYLSHMLNHSCCCASIRVLFFVDEVESIIIIIKKCCHLSTEKLFSEKKKQTNKARLSSNNNTGASPSFFPFNVITACSLYGDVATTQSNIKKLCVSAAQLAFTFQLPQEGLRTRFGHPMLRRQVVGESWRGWKASCYALCSSFRLQANGPTTRDKQRSQPNADPTTGHQMSILESPDLTPQLQFSLNTLEHVALPDVSKERRSNTDIEREKRMQKKFGAQGPGEPLSKSSQQLRRDMMIEQQDVDGLPWEVRWKKSLIPTSEEVIQDLRDRFELFIQDPIDREQEWYLHWKDRGFKIQKDRMIWPQGYTDYLDHYDEHGRRRVLPTDQRWSDSSWKHLADTNYRDRMWLIEGEERKAVHESMQAQDTLMLEEEQRQIEMGDVIHGIHAGVIDLDTEQTYQTLSGSGDPLEAAKTKLKIQAYGAGQALKGNDKKSDPSAYDHVTQLGNEMLPSGVTVQQGAMLAAEASIEHEMLEQRSEAARQAGRDPTRAMLREELEAAKKKQNKPMMSALVEEGIQQLHHEKEERQKLKSGETKALGVSAPAGETSSGFIQVKARPKNAEPDIPAELCRPPQSKELHDMPNWYRETLVETGPMIQSYGLTQDPLEQSAVGPQQWYTPAPMPEEERITQDDAQGGTSAFDEKKMHKLRTLPELVDGYKPLPLFHEVQQQTAKEPTPEEKTTKSRRLRKERQERLRAAKLQYDPDMMLPSLPWESDSVVDPYRGIAETSDLPFNKKDLEITWRAYRESFQQTMTEFGNLTQITTEANCEKMLMDRMVRFREGHVGDHPNIAEEQEEVFRLIFEGHTKHFLADYYKFKGNRPTEANAMKAQGDEVLRRASAKSKLLGKKFMDFVQEMTALELDTIRKNPVQRYCVLIREKKYESIAKPFMKWIKNELGQFNVTEFNSVEQLDVHREFLARHCNDARSQVPSRVEGVPDSGRDAAVEAFYHWCRGALCYYAAKHFHRMYIDFADTRLRSRAEELFEDSIEWFSNYAKTGKNIVQIPIPDADPPYEYDEKEFLDGESAVFAEISGHLDKAEAIWHSGSSKRWYPMVDETEYMWFNERRGRLSLALDISDRCLENVNKKTHPTIHPFPERAKIFLEGAPLTQETAEHLWMRYMGDLYWEHSELMFRQGMFRTGRSYKEKCLNFYHLAIRTARERLPSSWKAPLLTHAKYLLRVYEPGGNVLPHLQEVETIVAKLFALKEPTHWIEPFSELPYRIAVVHANLAAYGEAITQEVSKRTKETPSQELLLRNMAHRASGGRTLPELVEYFAAANSVADELFRKKVLQWRAQEREGSDPYLFWTHLYFAFRVHPADADEVQQLWDMYEPAYAYIYTQCALACRQRGHRLINDSLRRMCQILLAGDVQHKKVLMKELRKVRDLMSHLVDRKELERTIGALELHLQNPQRPTYIYGTAMLFKEAQMHEKIARNPLLRSQMAEKDYDQLRIRRQELRDNGMSLHPHQSAQQQSDNNPVDDSASDNSLPGAELPALQTRKAFHADS